MRSLKFVLSSAFWKIFSTKSYDVANKWLVFINCAVTDATETRIMKLLSGLLESNNLLCQLFRPTLNRMDLSIGL